MTTKNGTAKANEARAGSHQAPSSRNSPKAMPNDMPSTDTMRTIEAVAQADASCAWCVFIGATSGTVLAILPPDTAREIFHRPDVLLGGVFAPRGKAVAEEGGFRVNGRWQWGSGTENADWVMGGCQVIRDGEVERMKNGAPRSRMMIAPAAEIEFFDTWYVSGLCGTGSTDFAMNDLFVPEGRAASTLGPDFIEAMTTGMFLDFMAIRLDSRKVGSEEFTINLVTPDNGEQLHLLETLAHVENVDQFLHSKFLGAKRFSVSGAESMICLLNQLIDRAGDHDIGGAARRAARGMPDRLRPRWQ